MAPCINDDGVRIRPGQSADDADDVSAVAMTGQTNANATMAVSGVEERFIEDEARQQVPLSRVRNNGEGAERGRCYGCRSVIFVTSIKAHPLNTISGDFRVRFGHKMTLMTAE